jgi:hypothetical protein
MERHSMPVAGNSKVLKTVGCAHIDPLNLKVKDEKGRTFQDLIANDSQKYLKEVLVLGVKDFEHGEWENYENSCRIDAKLQRNNSLNNLRGETVCAGEIQTAGSASKTINGTIGPHENTTTKMISGEQSPGKRFNAVTDSDTMSEEHQDNDESGIRLKRGELVGDKDVEKEENSNSLSWGARMIGAKKDMDPVSKQLKKQGEWAYGREEDNEDVSKTVEDGSSQWESAITGKETDEEISPPHIPDYIMANEAGGTDKRNIRLVRGKRGMSSGLCNLVENANAGYSALGVSVARFC